MSVPCFQSAMLTGTGLASACALGYYAFTRAAHIAFFFSSIYLFLTHRAGTTQAGFMDRWPWASSLSGRS